MQAFSDCKITTFYQQNNDNYSQFNRLHIKNLCLLQTKSPLVLFVEKIKAGFVSM